MYYHLLLKASRKLSGLSLRQAAQGMGITYTTLYRYEEGLIEKIPMERLIQIFRFYNLDLNRISVEEQLAQREIRLRIYKESRQEITADFLYKHFMSLDERGQSTVLDLMFAEALNYPASRQPR